MDFATQLIVRCVHGDSLKIGWVASWVALACALHLVCACWVRPSLSVRRRGAVLVTR